MSVSFRGASCFSEPFSSGCCVVEVEDDESGGCDFGDGGWVEGDSSEGFEAFEEGVGSLGRGS